MNAPVIVVGAGLAGLSCAIKLHRAGRAVRVFEASDAVGGMLRTDIVGGFRLDRGFQVLQTAYPEARAMLDYDALELAPFDSGAVSRFRGRFRPIDDPFRHPSRALRTLTSGVIRFRDIWSTLRLRAESCRPSLEALLTSDHDTTAHTLDALGFSEPYRQAFLEPFYRGVLLEPDLVTSSRFLRFTFRQFATGAVALPRDGIQAIPAQLAAHLPAGVVGLDRAVEDITPTGVRLVSGEHHEASAVVVATDAETARRWHPELPRPTWSPVGTVSFSAERAATPGPRLILAGDRDGPVNHVCFPSEVQASYAPAGKTLVQASILGPLDGADEDWFERVRQQLHGWWGDEVDGWVPLRVERTPRAVPLQDPDWLTPATRPVRLGPGRFVAGGHRETSSIGGALRSGRRAAEAVLAE